jgi:hypothetical protein
MTRAVRFYSSRRAGGARPGGPSGRAWPGEAGPRVEAVGLNNLSRSPTRRSPLTLSSRARQGGSRSSRRWPGVAGVEVGQRVTTIPCFEMGRYGCGDSAIVPAHALARTPSRWSRRGRTSGSIDRLRPIRRVRLVKKGDALITAATTAGHAAIQFCRLLGGADRDHASAASARRCRVRRRACHRDDGEDLYPRESDHGWARRRRPDPVAGPGLGAPQRRRPGPPSLRRSRSRPHALL